MTARTAHWAKALQDAWGIEADLEPLPGEFDLNFRVTTRTGRRAVLKVMRAECEAGFVDLLAAAHSHVRTHAAVPVPQVLPTKQGAHWCSRPDADGRDRMLWLLTGLEGVNYATFRPHPLALIEELGGHLARLDGALADFSHPQLERELKWDLRKADWIRERLTAIPDASRRRIVEEALAAYTAVQPALLREPVVPIHNDLNDHNILVALDAEDRPAISGLIDFGDVTRGPVVAELAIAGAYVALEQEHPERAFAALVAGYHAVAPLTAGQISLLWPLLRARLAVSVVNSAMMARSRPGDAYVTVSEAPAWRLLERTRSTSKAAADVRLRLACGLPPTDGAGRAGRWLASARGTFAPVVRSDLTKALVGSLAVIDSAVPRDPFHMTAEEATGIGEEFGPDSVWIGRYGEPRLVYTAPAFRSGAHRHADRRTVHLGLDLFLPPGTAIHAPYEALVESVEYRGDRLDYGGLVVLKHVTPEGDWFSTLYGHLSRTSLEHLTRGQRIARGAPFAAIGDVPENGGWSPHLHLQLLLDPSVMGSQWPGVADPDDLPFWTALCPNPAVLLGVAEEPVAYHPLPVAAIASARQARFATNLRLSYAEPCLLLRGWRTHLFDEWGRPYLDAYNNVPHVGHSHPRIRAVSSDQLARINTNTRYLHPVQVEFAETLLAKLPNHLTHVFLVNSGSEANELALRLARTHTGGRDMVVTAQGYHGNTTGTIAVSSYKFDQPGGGGAPDWVQVVPVADTYRGAHRGVDAGVRYAAELGAALTRIRERGGRLAGFIAETFPSVAGQLIPPPGYLPAVYEAVRAAGGVCIADEVQTGLGRLGGFYWGFEQQRALPDMVVLGKPLGNGHPIGAVVTTAAIARSFDNGIEFFSTFGGSTLSCRVGTEVLRIVDEEGLQAQARMTGAHLLDGLR
ncbi:MAG: aminotransferase class III-fold pyridoxal phosphate-dependent enzyme, partial [Gemmatimonadota bacterium]|nr:aminotransferase class III-fold pyridoxal phosphate-dependent enzyme [Gemmatimonadota bacterium]